MGQSSQQANQSQSSTTAPGAMTAPTVQALIDKLNPLIAGSGTTAAQTGAINQLTANGQAGNPYAAAEGANATQLLNGGGAADQNGNLQSNLDSYKGWMSQYLDPNYSTINSPEVQKALQAAHAGVQTDVNSMFMAGGRTGSDAHAGSIAYNTEKADAPIILNQANADTATRMGAANGVYNAGNTTSGAITGNNQTSLTNKQAGTTAAGNALDAENWGPQQVIAAQQMGQKIPADMLGFLAQIGIPLSQLNMTSNGQSTSNTTNNPSLLSQISQIGGLFSSGAGGTSAAAGAGQAAAGAGSGILSLLAAL